MSLDLALSHRRGGFTLEATVTAPPGVTALFGPSGSGKSTILAAVAGLLRPDRGRVVASGRVLLDTARGIDLPPEHRRCGVVFQDSRLFAHLDVRANLRFGLRRAARRGRAGGPGLDEIVALLGLGALLDRRPAGLSGGERARVAIGRALLSRPALLLMDEPLAALDAPRRADILDYLHRLRGLTGGLSMLYVTHALDEVDRLADTLVLLDAGRVRACGPVFELMARPDLAEAFGAERAGALVAARIAAHHPERGLSELAFDGGSLWLPLLSAAPGSALRVRIRARDIALATERPAGLSSHNLLPARITALAPAGPHECLVVLACGATPLLALLTRDAVTRLGLDIGRPVWAVVKSVTLTGP
ncbi:molybdate transport system ATP-binding protein [Endobacter medicaginis]|uniref:Molybdate transport system ATP-binding protein n=2 Tax=Endobacter medicaginis TaxID=1181271 RepID=A0A839V2Q7_9PROT|nr:molybdenum ABC transporter ATP-binding protein [Endobacter medicaginis]MBB3175043.1 molybdate transport system ATP-binding protein [Endobacter medicaginis]MCX5476338.1 molybdenum ABC transporter ATP-binding protein [Endobacter medicaginis]